MKLEDLTQESLDELLANVASLQESTKGLKADLAKAKAKAKGADIDPEEHAALQSKIEELQSALSKAEGSSKKEIEKLANSLKEKDGALNKYLVEAGLTDALVKAGVKPEFLEAGKALLKSQTTINSEYQPLIGDKPLAEAVKEWAAGDAGKHFVQAPANNGGGAQGGGNNSNNQPKTSLDKIKAGLAKL